MSKELKPCPFCGGKAKKQAKEIDGIRVVYVMCNTCGASSGVYRTYNPRVKDEENPAIKAWNNRKPMYDIALQLELNSKMYSLSDRDCEIAIPLNIAIEIVKGGAKNV